MEWTTPQIKEISLNCEINSYCSAKLLRSPLEEISRIAQEQFGECACWPRIRSSSMAIGILRAKLRRSE